MLIITLLPSLSDIANRQYQLICLSMHYLADPRAPFGIAAHWP
jgi:hypothetical protein